MPETDIGSADYSNLRTQVEDYSVSPATTDGVSEGKETTYTNSNWNQQLGYYFNIPELTSVIDAKAAWTVGKGYISDEITTLHLNSFIGFGKDTFNTILENCVRVYHIGGDSFCEKIRDENGLLVNLKPLDPSSMTIVADKKGVIIRYEQRSKTAGKSVRTFETDEIFHLARNRVADEIHGRGIAERLAEIILMRNEAMKDWKRVLHRNVDPLWIFHMDTDDTTKIAAFKTKMDASRGKGENMYIPKGAVVPELQSVAPNATLNPLPWIEALNDYFYEAAGVPKIVIGGSKVFTDASAKTTYLAWQQTIEEEQLFIEEQVLLQLEFEIKLEFPASLEAGALSEKQKGVEEESVRGMPEPNDTKLELEGRK